MPEKEIVLLAHSAGGWAATEAAVRKQQNLPGGIIGILYAGAFVVPVGESIHSFFQPKNGAVVTPPYLRFHNHGRDGLATLIDAETFLFNDLRPEEAAKWAATLTASPIVKTVLRNDAYAAVPCAYLVLEKDRMLLVAYQEGMAAAQGEKTGPFRIYRCEAGHSPHLSWTRGLVDVVRDFVGRIGGSRE